MPRRLKRLSDALRPGMRVFVPAMAGESAWLTQELLADPERAAGVDFCAFQFPGIDRSDYLALHPQARLTGCFMSPSMRAGMAAGRSRLLPLDYAGLIHYLRHGPAFDVAIAQVSPPDADGRCSLGLSSDFTPLAWVRATSRIAHVNPLLPRTRGSFTISLSETDGWVEAESAPPTYSDPAVNDIDRGIARTVAGLIRDGDTLQFGIGTIPLALGQALASHRRLRLHTGMVTRTLQHLWEAGALDRDARIITGVALGDRDFHRFVAELPPLWFTDVSQTHHAGHIAVTPRFIAVNAAVEVDLFGQVNSERMGGALQAGAGGLPAFAQGALASEGGRLIICLRATAARGTVSRIVPSLGDKAVCTLGRHLADTVVTEYGIAELRHRSVSERAEALIAIAAPERREELSQSWAAIRSSL